VSFLFGRVVGVTTEWILELE